MVLRVCRALVGSTDADDVWSETFLSALRAYPTLRVDSNVLLDCSEAAARRNAADGIARLRRDYTEQADE